MSLVRGFMRRDDRRWWLLAVGLAAVLAVVVLQVAPSFSEGAPEAGPGTPRIHAGPDGRIRLGGPWVVRLDPSNRGADRGWASGNFAGKRVTVPYVPQAGAIRGERGIATYQGNVAWYRTTVTVPQPGSYALRFESVNHKAVVWIDGEKVKRHTGTYLPFEVRRFLPAGRHSLVVRADWRDPEEMKRQAWHRTWFNFGGINREVTIRPLAASELMHPNVITRLRPDGSAVVEVRAQLRNRGVTREVPVEGTLTLRDDGREVELPFSPVRLGRSQGGVVRAVAEGEDPELWSPEDPRLWDLRLEVPDETGYDARVGLREIRHRGRELLLNGRPIVLRGASIHEDVEGKGDALAPEEQDWIVGALQGLGANATRSQHPVHPALLERLDAAGIMVYMGVGVVDAPGAWTSQTPRLRAQSRDRVITNVNQMQAHPSVITWNLANEVAGDGHPNGQAPWIDAMARELKRRDPSRPIALDIWGSHPPRYPSPMYRNVDIIGWTNYIGWYESTYNTRPQVQAQIRRELGQLRRAMPGKAIVVTEFGAEGNALNADRQPGGFAFQTRLLRTHLEAYRRDPQLNGALIWNLRDFGVNPSFAGGSISRQVPGIRLVRGVNQKGLFDERGRPKPAVSDVRALLMQWGAALAGP
ncbi:MAG TPA: glycoside hydrolase family 2 TIM barrel-domain containing protein [Solirubrobacteraceae bacterium]|nr:glycoside hydrolase family 2 TIM barrel-domain containing protein [Solirubrobacteraceae bacterium]